MLCPPSVATSGDGTQGYPLASTALPTGCRRHPSSPTDSDDRHYPPYLDAGPRRLIIIIEIYIPVQLRLHARDDNERENVRTYLLYYFRNM